MLNLSTALATFPVLQTERLTLREITVDDGDPIFANMRDPQVMRYYGIPMRSREAAVQRVTALCDAFRTHKSVYWAIIDRASGTFVGTSGFWQIVRPDFRAHIAYELAPVWWNRGVMTEAVGVILTFGFETRGLHSVEAGIHPDNIGSRRVLEKLGFVQEGYFREKYFDTGRNCFIDTAVFSLLDVDWRNNARTMANTAAHSGDPGT